MTKKLLFPLALAFVLFVSSISVFAEGPKKIEPGNSVEVKDASVKEASKAKTKLKTDVEKLVAAAKDGKLAPHPQQFPPTARNNLSKTAKIAILASAIGSAIFLIVIFHELGKD